MTFAFAGFVLFIGLLVSLDLGVLGRKRGGITLRESLIWSALWISISIAFSLVIYDGYEHHRFGLGFKPDVVDGRVNDGSLAATKFFTGYILEKALSVDNLFVIAVIFKFLAIPAEHQHRVLFWGIFGSMLMRGVMIAIGIELIAHFHWMFYVFGAFLLITGSRLLLFNEREADPSREPLVRILRRVLPLTDRYEGGRFLIAGEGRWMLTPLALSMILIEIGDAVFAFDSVPAVFAVTADPLLVFTSNVLAILGLRSLYFALAGLLQKFEYLKYSLSMVLILVGIKMIGGPHLKLLVGAWATPILLTSTAVLVAAGVIVSLVRHEETFEKSPPQPV